MRPRPKLGYEMTLSPLFEEEGQSAFKFQSFFRYSKVPEADYEEDCSKEAKASTVARTVLLSFVYVTFLATLPVSIWFCIKVVVWSSEVMAWCSTLCNVLMQRVHSLERCIIFRLGKRLPLKGPGFVITFPCIDVVDTIDLTPQTFVVAEGEQMLTSDGSVVEIVKFELTISVANAIRSFTQLKDSKANVQQFIKLSFANLIASSHVEDLERKIDWITKQYVTNCNNHICRWGWDVTCQEM